MEQSYKLRHVWANVWDKNTLVEHNSLSQGNDLDAKTDPSQRGSVLRDVAGTRGHLHDRQDLRGVRPRLKLLPLLVGEPRGRSVGVASLRRVGTRSLDLHAPAQLRPSGHPRNVDLSGEFRQGPTRRLQHRQTHQGPRGRI